MIQPHCMGLPFPKRDTDSPKVIWVPSAGVEFTVASEVADAINVLRMAEDLVSVAEDKVLARLAEKLGREIVAQGENGCPNS